MYKTTATGGGGSGSKSKRQLGSGGATGGGGSGSKSKRQLGSGGGDDGSGSSSGSERGSMDRQRCNEWWEKCDDNEFRKEFRINRSTFDFICQELSLVFSRRKATTKYHLRTRVAVCLWKLATGATSRAAFDKFGLSEKVVGNLFHEICLAITSSLKPKFVQWPNEETLVKIKTQFESIYKIPNVVGAIHTTHVQINLSKDHSDAYRNIQRSRLYKSAFYPITLQGVFDHEGFFIDVDTGGTGKMSDYEILLQSQLYKSGDRLVDGSWVVGNRSFPLMTGGLAMYPQKIAGMTPAQMILNHQITEIQQIAKMAFIRLKGRWLCLKKQMLVNLEDVPVVIEACCVLHNMCLIKKDDIDMAWIFDDAITDSLPTISVLSEGASRAMDKIAEDIVTPVTFSHIFGSD